MMITLLWLLISVKGKLSCSKILHQLQSHSLCHCVNYIRVAKDPGRLVVMAVVMLLKTFNPLPFIISRRHYLFRCSFKVRLLQVLFTFLKSQV